MTLGELINKLTKIGNQFASWHLIDSNVDSVELIGNEKEGYSVKVKLKHEPINEEELDKLANNQNRVRLLSSQQLRDVWKSGFKAGYRKAKSE